MKNAVGSCYWNHEINCSVGHVVQKHPELSDVLLLDFLCLHHYSPPISETSLVMMRVLMGSLC